MGYNSGRTGDETKILLNKADYNALYKGTPAIDASTSQSIAPGAVVVGAAGANCEVTDHVDAALAGQKLVISVDNTGLTSLVTLPDGDVGALPMFETYANQLVHSFLSTNSLSDRAFIFRLLDRGSATYLACFASYGPTGTYKFEIELLSGQGRYVGSADLTAVTFGTLTSSVTYQNNYAELSTTASQQFKGELVVNPNGNSWYTTISGGTLTLCKGSGNDDPASITFTGFSGNGGIITLKSGGASSGSYTLTLPAKTDTIATLSDISAGIQKLATSVTTFDCIAGAAYIIVNKNGGYVTLGSTQYYGTFFLTMNKAIMRQVISSSGMVATVPEYSTEWLMGGQKVTVDVGELTGSRFETSQLLAATITCTGGTMDIYKFPGTGIL